MKTTVIYHSADFDGVFCREIARKFLGNEGVEYIGWDFSDPPLVIPSEGPIYILDLPVDRVFGLNFGKSGAGILAVPFDRLIWIDHHKSSIETHPTDIPGYRIDGVSACRLAWQWFMAIEVAKQKEGSGMGVQPIELPLMQDYIVRQVKEPLAVRLAGEYDIWDKRDPRAEVFQFGLRSRELSQFDWDQMLSMERPSIDDVELLVSVGHQGMLEPDGTVAPSVVFGLLGHGELLQRYQQRTDATVMARSFLLEFEGLTFLALNTARCNSLTFAARDVPETGHDALMGFHFNGSGWAVSMYHAKHRTDIDLSAIAVKRGGGGHRGACGFQSNKLFRI